MPVSGHFIAPRRNPGPRGGVSTGVKQPGNGPAISSRAIEGAVMALVALFAADTLRPALAPLWQAFRLLFGL
jgi:hypothetical protein